MKKTYTMGVRCSPEQYERWRDAAGIAFPGEGESALSIWVRQILDREARNPTPKKGKRA